MNQTQRDLMVLAAGISVGVGVGLGMLLAPRSGREAQELLQTTAEQAVDRGRDYWQCIRTRGGGTEVADMAASGKLRRHLSPEGSELITLPAFLHATSERSCAVRHPANDPGHCHHRNGGDGDRGDGNAHGSCTEDIPNNQTSHAQF